MADRKTLELQIQLIADRASAQLKTFSSDVKNAAENAKNFTGNSKSVASSIKAMQEEAKRTAASIKLFGGNTNELRNTTARMKATILDLIQGGLKPESQEVQNLVNQYKNLESQLDSTERQQNGFLGMLGEIKNEIGGVAVAAAALAVDKALVGFAAGALEVNNSFQAARDNFGIMLNDMEAGRGLFNELQEFNFWTPFDIETTAQATAVLRTAKVELGDITKYLTRFGDLSRGNAQTMQSFTNAFSKASAKGKADMEVLNVFIDQGVQILDQLAKQMGKTSAQIVKMASEGKISFADLDQAIAELTSEGGQYYNTMATAAMRLDAVQAGLEESTKSLRASFGEMLAPVVAKVLGIFTDIVDAINNSPILKGILAAAVTALTVAVNLLAGKALVALIASLWKAYAAKMALNSAMAITNPAMLALIGATAAATAGFVAYAASQQKAADVTAKLALEQQKLDEQLSSKKWMSNLSLEGLQTSLESYRNTIIPSAEKLKKEAEEKLATIPQTITVKDSKRSRGLRLITKDNPEYKEALAAVEEQTKRLQEYGTLVKSIEGEIQNRISEHANAIAAFGTEWQDKLASETPNILAEQERALAKLNKKAEEAFGANYAKEKAYLQEKAALNKYYAEKIAEENKKRLEKEAQELAKARSEVDKWLYGGNDLSSKKNLLISNMNAEIENFKKAADKINLSQEDRIVAEGNLRLKFEKDIKNLVASEHSQRMADIKQEADYRAALAQQELEKGNVTGKNIGDLASNTAVSEYGNTDLGNSMMSSFGGIIGQVIQALVKIISSIENVGKILNWINTILEPIIEIIGPIVNDLLQPFVEELTAVGKALGSWIQILLAVVKIFMMFTPIGWMVKLLTMALEKIAAGLQWFYNSVIVPVGNMIILAVNEVIELINKLPGVQIKTFNYLTKIGDAAQAYAEAVEKATEMITKKFDRLISAVNDTLQAQLDALKSQYELGLISRKSYESQAEKYQTAADEATYRLEKEKNRLIEQIRADTNKIAMYFAYTQAKQQSNSIIDKVKGFFSFDVGTTKIPFDQLAMVHEGETIIPKTFAEGIRSGDLALVGKKDKNNGSVESPIVIQMNIEGSVVTENQIVDAVYNGIAKGIQQKKYTPLPGAIA